MKNKIQKVIALRMDLVKVLLTLSLIFAYIILLYLHRRRNRQDVRNPIRIYLGGCWDLMHSGHYNAIRQAKALGDILVVGIVSDEEIARNKRLPVMKNEQRIAAVKACKWVDEIIFPTSYNITPELLKKANCDFVAHGDDIAVAADGQNIFHAVMDKLKIFPRTYGVSTTHLIEKLLVSINKRSDNDCNNILQNDNIVISSSIISQFSNHKTSQKNDIIVYIDGVFDLFHIGHIAAFQKAKKLGTFLYVGVYNDEIVGSRKGEYYPLMNLHERVLNVLSCKYVDDVIIGSPWNITKQFLKLLNIKYVVYSINTQFAIDEFDRYDIPKHMGMFKDLQLKTETKYTTDMLMKTIIDRQQQLMIQNVNKVKQMQQYIHHRTK